MSYLLFAIARLFGRAAAPRIERKWQDSTMDPEKLASRRIAEAMLPQLKRKFGPEGWAFLTQRYENQCGALLPEWRVAELHLAGLREESRAKAAKYPEAVAAAYEPLVPALRASMTPQAWEERSVALARSWMERGGGQPADLKDWQVAQEIHPIPLDEVGRPRKGA